MFWGKWILILYLISAWAPLCLAEHAAGGTGNRSLDPSNFGYAKEGNRCGADVQKRCQSGRYCVYTSKGLEWRHVRLHKELPIPSDEKAAKENYYEVKSAGPVCVKTPNMDLHDAVWGLVRIGLMKAADLKQPIETYLKEAEKKGKIPKKFYYGSSPDSANREMTNDASHGPDRGYIKQCSCYIHYYTPVPGKGLMSTPFLRMACYQHASLEGLEHHAVNEKGNPELTTQFQKIVKNKYPKASFLSWGPVECRYARDNSAFIRLSLDKPWYRRDNLIPEEVAYLKNQAKTATDAKVRDELNERLDQARLGYTEKERAPLKKIGEIRSTLNRKIGEKLRKGDFSGARAALAEAQAGLDRFKYRSKKFSPHAAKSYADANGEVGRLQQAVARAVKAKVDLAQRRAGGTQRGRLGLNMIDAMKKMKIALSDEERGYLLGVPGLDGIDSPGARSLMDKLAKSRDAAKPYVWHRPKPRRGETFIGPPPPGYNFREAHLMADLEHEVRKEHPYWPDSMVRHEVELIRSGIRYEPPEGMSDAYHAREYLEIPELVREYGRAEVFRRMEAEGK